MSDNVKCACDVTKAKLNSKGIWVCPQCGRDVSADYIRWHQAQKNDKARK